MSKLLEKLKEKEQERQNHSDYSVIIWKPEKGEVLEGTVDEIGHTITDYGDADFISLTTDDEQKYMIFLNSVLSRLVDEEDVRPGDRIAIKYIGMKQSKKSNKKYKDYLLVKDDE